MIFSEFDVALIGFAGVLIGYLLGNRLAIDLDKRREYNALVNSIRFSLMGERDNPGGFKSPDRVTLLKIREHLHCWERSGFDGAVEAYKKSKGAENRQPDGGGGFHIIDKALIVHAADDLLKYLKPR